MVDMLITEVNDALRKDKWQQFFDSHKRTIIWVVAAIIAGTAGGQIYRSMKRERDSAFTAAILHAKRHIETGRAQDAIEQLSAAREKSSGEQKAFVSLWLARAQLADSQKDAAKATLQSMVENGQGKNFWRDSACVWLAGIDGAMPKACAPNSLSDLSLLANEMLIANLLFNSEFEKARSLIREALSSKNITQPQRLRIKQLQLLLPPQNKVDARS